MASFAGTFDLRQPASPQSKRPTDAIFPHSKKPKTEVETPPVAEPQSDADAVDV